MILSGMRTWRWRVLSNSSTGDWPAVEKEIPRGPLELNPNDAMVRNWYGEYLQEMGRNEEAFVQMRQAMVLDPLSSAAASELGYIFYTARQYDAAIRCVSEGIRAGPGHDHRRHVVSAWLSLYEEEMYKEAIAELEKAVNLRQQT